MAVLPKKYSKRGPISVEDYLIYMTERIEFDSAQQNKRILELEKKCDVQANEIAELKEKIKQQES